MDNDNEEIKQAVYDVLDKAIMLVDDTPAYADEAFAMRHLIQAVTVLRKTEWLTPARFRTSRATPK